MDYTLEHTKYVTKLRPLSDSEESDTSSQSSRTNLIRSLTFEKSDNPRPWSRPRVSVRPSIIYWSTACFGSCGLLIGLLYCYIFLRIPPSPLSTAATDPLFFKETYTTDNILSEYVPTWLNDASLRTTPAKCHSHNDYWRPYPLFSALSAGCAGIEADVWLKNGDLLVGHDESDLSPDRTLESMYINPLLEILNARNPNTTSDSSPRGIFPLQDDAQVTLLIDVKSNATTTWPLVLRQLQPLRSRAYLTTYNATISPNTTRRAPITVVGSGNLNLQTLRANTTYDAFHDTFLDAPLLDLPPPSTNTTTNTSLEYDARNSYYASVNFNQALGSVRLGFSDAQREKLRAQVLAARAAGLQPRYWGAPSWPPKLRDYVWGELTRQGVEVLSADDVQRAARGGWDQGYLDSVAIMVAGSVYTFLVSGLVFWMALRRKIR